MLDPHVCWVDAWAFERIARKAEDRHLDVEAMEKALALYRGILLPSDTSHAWTSPTRESLRSKYLAVVSSLTRHWERLGSDERAAKWYERALEVDHLDEEFYRRLMACYQRLGQQAEAVQTYERCRETLAIEVGITPSRSSDALYAFISSQDQG